MINGPRHHDHAYHPSLVTLDIEVYSAIMDESSSLDALAGLLEQLADNPRDFSVHIQHITLAKSLEGLEAEAASVLALEMFTNCFAAGDEVWLELLDIKERSVNLDTVNGIEEILALYQRAEADYLCKREISSPG